MSGPVGKKHVDETKKHWVDAKGDQMKTTTEETVERSVYSCDVCGRNTGCTHYVCFMCARDLCGSCLWCDDRPGKGRDRLSCKRCWELGAEFRKAQVVAQRRYEAEIERQDALWKAVVEQDKTSPADAGAETS